MSAAVLAGSDAPPDGELYNAARRTPIIISASSPVVLLMRKTYPAPKSAMTRRSGAMAIYGARLAQVCNPVDLAAALG